MPEVKGKTFGPMRMVGGGGKEEECSGAICPEVRTGLGGCQYLQRDVNEGYQLSLKQRQAAFWQLQSWNQPKPV